MRCSRLIRQPCCDEVVGQPFEQLGMGRRVRTNAEVADGAHEPLSEMMLPDPVDDHAGDQRPAPCSTSVIQSARARR